MQPTAFVERFVWQSSVKETNYELAPVHVGNIPYLVLRDKQNAKMTKQKRNLQYYVGKKEKGNLKSMK